MVFAIATSEDKKINKNLPQPVLLISQIKVADNMNNDQHNIFYPAPLAALLQQ